MMDNLELLELLKFKFRDKLKVAPSAPDNRVMVEITSDILTQVAGYVYTEHGLRFIIASALNENNAVAVIYHFSKDDTGMILNLKVTLPAVKPEVDSLVSLFVAADWIEREMHELFGIIFKGHPNLTPLLSDGNWDLDTFPYSRQNHNEDSNLS